MTSRRNRPKRVISRDHRSVYEHNMGITNDTLSVWYIKSAARSDNPSVLG